MNIRWFNHFLLFFTAISIAAASMGAIIRPPSRDGVVRGNTGNATVTSQDVILSAVDALETNQSLSALAKDDWGDGWRESWGELEELRKKKRPAGVSIPEMPTEDDFIKFMLGNENLKNELTRLLSLPDRPDLDSEKNALAGIRDLVTLDQISGILTEKNALNGFLIPAAEPSPETDENLKLAGFDFVLAGEPAHWITVQEVAAGSYQGENHGITEIESTRQAGGFPENWSVRRPSEGEWKSARERSAELGLENFNGGLGEVLDDGRIIGEADGFPKSAALGPLIHDKRDEATQIETSPQKVIIDPRQGRIVIPAQYASEPNFATRIVIVPPTD